MRRSTSATGVPVSACFSANAICSSVTCSSSRLRSSPQGLTKPENSHSNRMKKTGRRHFGRHIAKDRENKDLRRKATVAVATKMARVVHALIKTGTDYRPFQEG